MLGIPRSRSAAACFGAVMVTALPNIAQAESVTLRCQTSGAVKAHYGQLSLIVDETARSIVIRPERPRGMMFAYEDGRIGPIIGGEWRGFAMTDAVVQFVIFRHETIELGFRSLSGELLHLAWFERAALRQGKCHWRSLWEFDLAASPEPHGKRQQGNTSTSVRREKARSHYAPKILSSRVGSR